MTGRCVRLLPWFSPPDSHTMDKLIGLEIPAIDAAADRDDPRYRYNFYTDRAGRHDLVARRPGETLIIEAKGTSAKPDSGLEQLIGRSIMSMTGLLPGARCGILIPGLASWTRKVAATSHPALQDVPVLTVSKDGAIGRAEWGNRGEPS
jgi:hypothetical protein